jgi:predicted amino acid dehydrogenase
MGRLPSSSPRQFRLPKRQLPAWSVPSERERDEVERTRFAFVAHPLDVGDMRRFDSSLQPFTDAELEQFRSRMAPFAKPFPIGGLIVRSADGKVVEGELIMLPYLPSEIVALPWNESLDLVQSAVDLAVERGAKVVGLGGFSSIVADGGLALRTPADVSMTSGNSFTTWAAIRAVEAACADRGLDPTSCTVAIVGAAGAIGQALSFLCAERMAELILIGNPRAGKASIGKLQSVAEDCKRHVVSLAAHGRTFPAGTFAERQVRGGSLGAPASDFRKMLTVTTDLDQHLPRAQIIFAATSAVLPFISSKQLGQNAVVCDVSRPFNLASDLTGERPDIRIVRGGLVQAPETSSLGFLEERGRQNVLVACAAETIILALCQYRSNHLCGRLDVATIEKIGVLAERMGFSVAP